ncbi:hypothetical protein [uncultured Lamprocystis sp.]|jgi:hypothetical protein|uniref:hypothetical protein n=1 Tax=uncultured Lamprocystis sp. TaxID=543132 RepID=UPI0025F7FD04|nr:hypothetical protein [uncultured Lamprocystis sp.]
MHLNDTPTPSKLPINDPAPDLTDGERRAALAKLGALAAWTAPTMLILMTSARADDFGSPDRP